tara:strand:+ start:61 stop:852 length:792 start_codon:yes stop_codon:yes gene_type:complete
MENSRNSDLAILICSFDGYSCLWLPHIQSIRKFWPECSYKIYLGTNYLDSNLEGVESLKIGQDFGWSDNVLKCVEKINSKYILLFHDDLFLSKKVENKNLEMLVSRCVSNNWNYLRIHNSPGGNVYIDKSVSEILSESQYRTSVVSAIFKKEILLELLNRNENAWEFEINGSKRSRKYKNFYVVNTEPFSLLNIVIKGRVDPLAMKNAKKLGLDISGINLPIMNSFEIINLYLHRFLRSLFFLILPDPIKSKLISLKNYYLLK